MSDNESSPRENGVIDIERLIIEVEKRPGLYNKQLKDYSDRNIKEKLWGEVCVNVIRNWNELAGPEKNKKGKEVQNKWKNVKDCFSRELAAQRKLTSGAAAKKRRKYIHFDALLFLLPLIQDRGTSSNVEVPDNSEINEEPPSRPSSSHSKESTQDVHTPRRPTKRTSQNTTSYESSLLEILKSKQNEEISEDKSFALMLVPMMAKLNDEQKHYAKVEILNIMNNAKYYHPPPLRQPPTSSAYPSYNQSLQYQMAPNHNPQTRHPQTVAQPQNSGGSTSMVDYYSQFSEDVLSPGSTSSDLLFDMSNQ